MSAQKKGWKAIQSKNQVRNSNKLALVILATVVVLLLLSKAVKFTNMLFRPWQLSHSAKRTALWNGDFNLNVIMRAKSVSLLSVNPQEKKVTIIDLPQNLYLEATEGFGKWQLGSIYDLGESQSIGGGQLLKDTLTNFFGLPIDGFLQFSQAYSQKESVSLISEIRNNPFSIINFLPFLKTDLTPVELIRLKFGLSAIRFDKIKRINLTETDVLQKDHLADGTEVLSSDEVKLDAVLASMKDSEIQSDHKTVAIFNGTNHPGLAKKAARLITNLGGDVIITQNRQNVLKTTQIFGEKSKTLSRIKQIFEADDIISGSNKDLVSSRAQINLLLGEDFFNRL